MVSALMLGSWERMIFKAVAISGFLVDIPTLIVVIRDAGLLVGRAAPPRSP